MKSYERIAKEVDGIVDELGLPVDEGIKRAVIALRLADIHTHASCEGHIEDGLLYPWILIEGPKQEGSAWKKANRFEREKVTSLLNDFYHSHTSEHPLILQDQGIFGAFRIQSVYWHQKDAVKPDDLENYRDEMNAFADFILKKLTSPS